jgi:type I restriction-modification system DNA methylase subunit
LTVDEVIHKHSQVIAKKIAVSAKTSQNEAEFRTKVTKIIEDFADIPEVAELINLRLNVHEEYTLIRGSADVVYNRLVIEYESPFSLRAKNSYRPNEHAIKQVKTYIEDLHKLERHKIDRIAGVVLDGHYFIFVRWRDKKWAVDDPLPVTPTSTEQFLRYLSSLSTEIALTPAYLIRDFGENTVVSRLCVNTFYEAIMNTSNPKVHTLFSQWNLQFSEVCGYEEGSTRFDIKDLAKKFGIKDSKLHPFKLFFCIHTYYATFIKLLAIQIASYYAFPGTGTALQKVANYTSQELLNYLNKMERGGVFRDFGINNFLEGDFFGWYLDIWDDSMDKAVRRIISELANYSLITLDVDPEETRDLLKKLYQNLMPRTLRHNLGEYYTPDWLAERLLVMLCGRKEENKADIRPDMRILDPACGSGTFLVIAIQRICEYAKEKNIPQARILEKILENIVGFDLNPLAVISARTNYLLAIGDLLKHRKEEINIPVYLADSILTPSQKTFAGKYLADQFELTESAFSFETTIGEFSIPQSLVDVRYIDKLANLLEECVSLKLSTEEFRKRLLQELPLREEVDKSDIQLIEKLFDKLMDLDSQKINGIWARIIKNAFAPLFVGKFDYIAGNPPWVNWESLPDKYRQRTKILWERYGLFPHGGMDTILGKGKKDISMLMTYVAIDNYLKDGGKLGFIITQSVFKTSGAGQGFRRFILGKKGKPIRVAHVDDMVELNPFEGASNRTAVMILQKGNPNRYPVPYTYWKKTIKGKSIALDSSLEDVINMTARRRLDAEPVDSKDKTSAWITGKRWALKAVKKVMGKSYYQAREGANSGGASGVYWVDIITKRPDGLVVISNITEKAKRPVENIQAPIEPDLIYPFLQGSKAHKWYISSSTYILLVQDPKKRYGISEEVLKTKYPKTYSYLCHFKDILIKRPAYKRYFDGKAPFYSMFNVGEYTLSPYKVVWLRISSRIEASVIGKIGDKPIIPQDTHSFIGLDKIEEAHFLSAVLNSSVFNFAAQSYSMRGGKSFGSPHILENIQIPKFDPEMPNHLKLSELSQQAHKAATKGDNDEIKEIEEKIDYYAARLWGLTEQELKDIKVSLSELNE